MTPPFRERRDESGFYGTFRINVDSMTAAIRNETGKLTTNVVLTAGDSLARRFSIQLWATKHRAALLSSLLVAGAAWATSRLAKSRHIDDTVAA